MIRTHIFFAFALLSCAAAAAGSLQQQIDAASNAGGGRVVLRSGVHESGTLYLKSNVELHLEEGAVLRGPADPDAYDDVDDPRIGRVPERSRKAFIVCMDAENVAITGKGTCSILRCRREAQQAPLRKTVASASAHGGVLQLP